MVKTVVSNMEKNVTIWRHLAWPNMCLYGLKGEASQ